jgi:transcriptional regulator with PAS, ATPase and Fis domain
MNQRQYLPEDSGQATGEEAATGEIAIGMASGPWTVELTAESGRDTRARLAPGQRLVIGSRGNVDLRVADSCVSGRHCLLDASGQELMLVDLSSKNGVYIGNVRVAAAKLSASPAVFTIGKTNIVVRSIHSDPCVIERQPIDGLEGRSEAVLRLKREIRRLAKLRAPVLILGETGVGKDVVARALHTLSGRSGPYVPLNVATIPETLADSELFGHKKGAFTGALQARIGAFEQAHRGTLFLDEIGELAPSVQAKMLRILEDGIVRPVGATEGRRVDARVISATWASLAERSGAGKFRFDLLQRLSMVVVDVPPLRERRSDIPILADCWLRRYSAELGTKHLSAGAIERLCAHDWPGNVRELGGTIYRACVMSDDDVIGADTIVRAFSPQGIRQHRTSRNPRELLAQAGGNVSEAARLAGLPRTTFRTWLGRTNRPESDKEGV